MLLYVLVLALPSGAQKLWEQAPEDYTLDGTLRKVHVIYRHGHKEPSAGYPEDPHENSAIWKHGPGQLTILGRRQAFYFGQNLRSRYRSFIPAEKGFKYVQALSSKRDRTLMTSSAVLAGLLPPKLEDIWSSIPWQPAAVYHDEILATNTNCPRLEQLAKFQFPVTNVNLYNYVTEHSGKLVTNSLSLADVYSCLEIQNQAGLPLPVWARPVFLQMKREAANAFAFNEEFIRLQVGRLLDKFTKSNSSSYSLMDLYCTHATVIGGLMAALKINQSEPPNFMSALIVELRELHGRFHFQLWYRIGPYDDLIRVPWPKCGLRCPVNNVRTILDPLIPKDWPRECDLFENGNGVSNIVISMMFLICSILVFVVGGYGSIKYQLVCKKRIKESLI